MWMQDDRHHEVGSPSMHGANEPAQCDVVIESLQTAPGLSGEGDVDQGEQNSRHKLEEKDGERRATEHVEPTRRIPRHGMSAASRMGVRAAGDGQTIRQIFQSCLVTQNETMADHIERHIRNVLRQDIVATAHESQSPAREDQVDGGARAGAKHDVMLQLL